MTMLSPSQVIVLATPVFFALIAVEWIISLRRGRNAYALADAISFWTRVPLSRVARSGVRGYDQWQRGDGTPLSVLMPRPGK